MTLQVSAESLEQKPWDNFNLKTATQMEFELLTAAGLSTFDLKASTPGKKKFNVSK